MKSRLGFSYALLVLTACGKMPADSSVPHWKASNDGSPVFEFGDDGESNFLVRCRRGQPEFYLFIGPPFDVEGRIDLTVDGIKRTGETFHLAHASKIALIDNFNDLLASARSKITITTDRGFNQTFAPNETMKRYLTACKAGRISQTTAN